MEMYSIPWGLAIVYAMGGPLLACLLVVLAVPIVIYGMLTRRYRRGRRANRIAFWFSITAILLSLTMWYELLTGRFLTGKSVDFSDPDLILYKPTAVLEVFVLSASIAGAILLRMRSRPLEHASRKL